MERPPQTKPFALDETNLPGASMQEQYNSAFNYK